MNWKATRMKHQPQQQDGPQAQAVAQQPPDQEIEADAAADGQEAQPHAAEEVQGRGAPGVQEVDRQQVEEAVDEAGHAVLGLAVLAGEWRTGSSVTRKPSRWARAGT